MTCWWCYWWSWSMSIISFEIYIVSLLSTFCSSLITVISMFQDLGCRKIPAYMWVHIFLFYKLGNVFFLMCFPFFNLLDRYIDWFTSVIVVAALFCTLDDFINKSPIFKQGTLKPNWNWILFSLIFFLFFSSFSTTFYFYFAL